MATRTRTKRLVLDVTEEEFATITANMKRAKTESFSAYARQLLTEGKVVIRNYSELKELTAAMCRIGTNINQIARRMNQTHRVPREDIDAVKRGQEELWQLLKSTLSKEL